MQFSFTTELWLYQGDGAWVFVTLPNDIAENIRLVTSGLLNRGFGSIKVTAKVNGIKYLIAILAYNILLAKTINAYHISKQHFKYISYFVICYDI